MISVLIPAYNTSALIERAISSVLHQSCQDFEIVVVDDASADNTLEVVRAIGDARIRIFEQEENRGPAAARNRALREARGEFCAYLDGDDYWEPEFLRKTSEFLTRHPEAVAVFTGQCHHSVSTQKSIRPRCLTEVPVAIREPMILSDFFQFWREQKFLVCTGSIMIRTEILRNLGGQREDLRIGEDLELWCLLGGQGPIGFIPEVLFVSDGNRQPGSRRQVHQKLLARWRGAPTVEAWSQRHQPTVYPPDYAYVRGEVAGMLIYAYIMRGDTMLACQTVRKYRDCLPVSGVMDLYRKCSGCLIGWWLFCVALRLRESLRNGIGAE